MKKLFARLIAIFIYLIAMMGASFAETISNPVGAFAGLDKITGRLTSFDVYVDETVQFGALQLTLRACHTQSAATRQQTTAFIEVDQVDLRGNITRIFAGWMFADSPALNAIDHAVYDIWLVDCKQSSDVPPPQER